MTRIPGKLARQRIKQYYTGDPNAPETCELTVDPRVGVGVPAEIGSLGVRNLNDADAQLFQKWGLLDTQWRLIGVGGGGNANLACIAFIIGDWVSSDGGDLFQLVIEHGLGTECVNIDIFDAARKRVIVHELAIINPNRISLKVSQREVDCRFSGTVNIVSLI